MKTLGGIDGRGNPPTKGSVRINDYIRCREVRLIDALGQQVGIVPTREALSLAKESGLDLIEVASTSNPPVCRIGDYGKFKYEQKKKQKKQRVVELKIIRFKPDTDEHDIRFKVKNAIRFLREGNKVKFTVIFKSREIQHPELGKSLLARVIQDMLEYGIIEKSPSVEGRAMIMILGPK